MSPTLTIQQSISSLSGTADDKSGLGAGMIVLIVILVLLALTAGGYAYFKFGMSEEKSVGGMQKTSSRGGTNIHDFEAQPAVQQGS